VCAPYFVQNACRTFLCTQYLFTHCNALKVPTFATLRGVRAEHALRTHTRTKQLHTQQRRVYTTHVQYMLFVLCAHTMRR
jgi:hypothetical protein